MHVQWIRCENEAWCTLEAVDLVNPHFIKSKGRLYYFCMGRVIWCRFESARALLQIV